MAAQQDALQKLQAQIQLAGVEGADAASAERREWRLCACKWIRLNSKRRWSKLASFDRAKIDAMLADARKQQDKAMKQIRSGAIQLADRRMVHD